MLRSRSNLSDGVNDDETSEGHDRLSEQSLHIEFVGHVAAHRGGSTVGGQDLVEARTVAPGRRSGGLDRVFSAG
jgi:hypothetical protein